MQSTKSGFIDIALDKLVPSPTNPRKSFDEERINELAQSILQNGVIQAIVVRKTGHGLYEIVCGERRYRASLKARALRKTITTIPAQVRDLTDEEVMEIQFIENLQREDVSPMDEAVAIKHLMANKKFDVQEIARRIGRAPGYVAKRLKLNDLSEDWQRALYKDQITLHDASIICVIHLSDQKELYKEKGDTSGKIILNKWDFNKYQNKLKNAPFDITDATLKKDMGACTSCTHNSAVNTLLFPDQEHNPICLNTGCFRQKCNINYDKGLKEALADSTFVIIRSSTYSESDESKKLVKENVPVLMPNQFEQIMKPVHDPDELDREDYDTDEEFEKAKKDDQDYFDRQLKQYDEKISTGKFRKAFVVDGNDKGKIIFISLRKKSATLSSGKKDVNDHEPTANDIKEEIDRINTREKRNQELDGEKIQAAISENLGKTEMLKKPGTILDPIEMDLMLMAIWDKVGSFDARNDMKKHLAIDRFDKDVFTKIRNLKPGQRAYLVRRALFSEYHTAINPTSLQAKIIRTLSINAGVDVHTIETAQGDIAAKRQQGVKKRLDALQAMKKKKPSGKK